MEKESKRERRMRRQSGRENEWGKNVRERCIGSVKECE